MNKDQTVQGIDIQPVPLMKLKSSVGSNTTALPLHSANKRSSIDTLVNRDQSNVLSIIKAQSTE